MLILQDDRTAQPAEVGRPHGGLDLERLAGCVRADHHLGAAGRGVVRAAEPASVAERDHHADPAPGHESAVSAVTTSRPSSCPPSIARSPEI